MSLPYATANTHGEDAVTTQGGDPSATFYQAPNVIAPSPTLLPNGQGTAPRPDPWMYASYHKLPILRHIALVPHFGGVPPVMNTFSASNVRSIYCSTKSKEFLAVRLYQALTTTHFNVYVNPSRARADQVHSSFEYGVIYYRIPRQIFDSGPNKPSKNACFLCTGVAAYSHLFNPYTSNVGNNTMEDRRVGVYPVEFEYQRGLSFLGTVSNKHLLRYSFCAGALHFVTRSKEYSDRFARCVPNQATLADMEHLGDQNDALFNVTKRAFPHALNFGCYVPIFDARDATFVFNEDHFTSLIALPLFESEVPHGALVTVGYTACTFHDIGTDPSLSSFEGVAMFFVQFVVLHSL